MDILECNEPVATGIRRIIATRKLKNIYVAKRAGFTRQQLSDMLNGRKLIKACDILKLSEVLGVTVNDIYEAGKGGN